MTIFNEIVSTIKEMFNKKPNYLTHNQMLYNKALRWTIRDFGYVWKNYEKDDLNSLQTTIKIISAKVGADQVAIRLAKNLKDVGYR